MAMVSDTQRRSSPHDLILYGGELSQGHTGVAVYLKSLIYALQRTPDTLRWAVALPESRQNIGNDLPPEHRLIIPGKDARGYLWNEVVWQMRTARWVKRHAPQAVFHTPFHFWSPVSPRKMMMTAHDCIEMHVAEVQQPGKVRRLHRALCWRMIRRALLVVSVSKWTRQDLIERVGVPPDRIAVLYNWASPTYSPRPQPEIASMRATYGLPERYIAYLGGFRSYKNVGLLMEAWRLARISNENCPALVLAGALPSSGAGHFYTDVRATIEKLGDLGKHILLPGAITDKDLPLFYAGACLFVSPSLFEGFGYPPLEASACGTPVLVSDRTAYREIFPDILRFSTDDAALLAQRILKALKEPKAHLYRVGPPFTEEAGKQQYEELVRKLLSLP